MKVNFNRNLLDYRGIEAKNEDDEDKPISIKDIICQYLYIGNGITDDATGAKRYMAYKLTCKLANSIGEVNITDKESLLIKEVCLASVQAGVYGQIVDILDA